ncbi:SRPBCC family protein [Arthrobacter sp. 131MFCol6.1]|uniref:SRPBCC family protein n=1 Tax=Arthrobacter sp. 131MFCol6.1 TaxID=1157944 RepID=UPI00037A5D78|nr:SRPBCC family protein [Arthrobacter sp. 131MFCol6.1]
MALIESQHLISACGPTVRDIITDARNFTVWDSGITAVSGAVRTGATIRFRTRTGGGRSFRVHVEQIPGEVMTWTRAVSLGLGKIVRTFALSRHDGMTRLRVWDETKGPLRGLIRSPFSFTEQDLNDFVNAVKNRAELLG